MYFFADSGRQRLTFSFRFSCLIFFFYWEFSRLHFGAKSFWQNFRILGSYERKGNWVVKRDFHGNFGSMLQGFLPFSPVSSNESCLFWYGWKDLFILHKLADKVVLDR